MLINSQLEAWLHIRRSVHFHPAELPDPPFDFSGVCFRDYFLLFGDRNVSGKLWPRLITIVSRKRAHGRSTLKVCKTGGWALF